MQRSSLTEAREFLERAIVSTPSRVEELVCGERICELMEMQELEECRQLRLVKRREHRQGVAFTVEVWSAA
ncbi:MAG TPA: hypothetical protein VJO33_17115 [Gemmatimonadaceae bacterium]|nr:hypothetical protein [Gemmatimonadaceae bacterium]